VATQELGALAQDFGRIQAKPKPVDAGFGSGAGSFGTIGTGGSFGFADPKARVGFAYAPNKMGFHVWDDPREKALRDAVYGCL
jgi:CubicO group peptidase (beta-lactamase class C family)